MMKINEFCKFYGISRWRLASCLSIPLKEGESDRKYQKRKDEFVRRRAGSGWEMMYVDGVVTMRSPSGALHEHEAETLDEYIETL